MSIKLVSSEISRFLGSAEPEVLCITGRWGVGKTFAWNRYLRQAQEDKIVKLERYSYVSMFGRNSLDDVRTAIVENTVDSRVVGTKPDLTSFKSIAEQLSSRIKNIPWLAGFVPSAAGYASSAYRVLFLMLKDQIVCIDDLERAGSGLGTMNILGLVTSLKVEKSCKVIIILNEEGLSGPDKEDFKTQLECPSSEFLGQAAA
jgi:Cdc6-like AAA superfamily ATPase